MISTLCAQLAVRASAKQRLRRLELREFNRALTYMRMHDEDPFVNFLYKIYIKLKLK